MATPTKEQVLESTRLRPDLTNVFKVLFPEYFTEPETYSVGQRFEINGWFYLLASVGFNDSDGIAVRLVNLDGGAYIGKDFVYVKEPRKITKEELQKIAGTDKYSLLA